MSNLFEKSILNASFRHIIHFPTLQRNKSAKKSKDYSNNLHVWGPDLPDVEDRPWQRS